MKQSGRCGLSPWPSEIVDYISFMTKECTVIYNGDCPICSREIDVYRDRVTKAGGSLGFVDLNRVDLGAFGLTADDAARRLYVVRGDELLSGVDAFLLLWHETPGFQWLARGVGLPGVRQIAGLVYEWVLAPALFALHNRRQAGAARGA
jgi:predicted DCC family thiol-disulfide oxidoreductase YuxK